MCVQMVKMQEKSPEITNLSNINSGTFSSKMLMMKVCRKQEKESWVYVEDMLHIHTAESCSVHLFSPLQGGDAAVFFTKSYL